MQGERQGLRLSVLYGAVSSLFFEPAGVLDLRLEFFFRHGRLGYIHIGAVRTRNVIQVQTEQTLGVLPGKDGGNISAEVATLREELRVAEFPHQAGPNLGNLKRIHSWLLGPAGKAEAWQRKDYNIEFIIQVCYKRLGICEQRADSQHLNKRSCPAVGR